MISTKKHIQQLAAILHLKGIDDIVISPGSRNGPLIHTFAGSGEFNCRSIVDERSAGYFATGLAQARQKAVALICTSGTAALNYAPAVAEAFYQHIPLVVLTADRPGYLIGQGESQTIRQDNIYRDFCKMEITLPLSESEKELWHAGRMINEVLNIALTGTRGPVHINVPLEEPLHELLNKELPPVKIIETTITKNRLRKKELQKRIALFNRTEKVLILAGQQNPNPKLEKLLAGLSEKTGAVILKEHLANLNHPFFFSSPDLLITSLLAEDMYGYQPDLLITFGGMFVSKPLKQFLRKNRPKHHWHLSPSYQHMDTYQSLTQVIPMDSRLFFEQILDHAEPKEQGYMRRWKKREQEVFRIRDELLSEIDFCDLSVFHLLQKSIPENSVVHLGNSAPVRYALLLDVVKNAEYYGNRGASGIDGSLSTAVGFASESKKMNTIVLGDLSFFYDSNALWNKYLRPNLRIIVIHNGGGNLFSMIKGPADSPAFGEFFFTENNTSAGGIAKTFGIDYFKSETETELEMALQTFYTPQQKKAAILEIFTDAGLNTKLFRELFKRVKTSE
jgi:2-succinyl-5-enolpyruvyl-6-hydroxy-3-cyclohexene-1-carboxylate synthase